MSEFRGGELRPALSRALFGVSTRETIGRGGTFVWLGFILIPLITAIGRREPVLQHGLTIGGAIAFVAAYMALVLSWRRRRSEAIAIALFAVMVALAAVLTLADRPTWGFLFIYCAVCAALLFPPPFGFIGVALCTVLGGGLAALAGTNAGTAIGFGASAAGIGLMMLLLRDLRLRNEELSEARAELAQLAVARERERFARDLHDLLGHTLSVIALKTELAGRLLPNRPQEARSEIGEVEEVARNALSEVRDAVSGYRRPTLEGELAGARLALSAAGIRTDVDCDELPIESSLEAVLAWAVREGTTNAIRHSAASRCAIRVKTGRGSAVAEIIDDGRGNAAAPGGGHGLAGLRERAQAVGGTVEARPLQDGGFRLSVTVPVAPRGSVGPSERDRSRESVALSGPDRPDERAGTIHSSDASVAQ
jgi:two-component system, NarL family, sensor histidine kinase DesK